MRCSSELLNQKGQVLLEEIHVVFAEVEFKVIQSGVSQVHKKCSGISGKLKNNIDLHCKSCLKDSLDQSDKLGEVEIEPNVKLECVSRYCYLGDMLSGG